MSAGGPAPAPVLSTAGRWILAIRPKTLPAAVAPVVLGTALAIAHGAAAPLPATAALAGALLIQIAANLANDYFDWQKGGDTETRLGPTRVVQAGLLSPTAVWRGMVLALALAFGVGVYLVAVGGLPILLIGLLSLLCAVAYTGGPLPLAYHGLGDLFAFAFFGPVAVAGTYWVQALSFRMDLILGGSGVGALITAILVVNNLRDRETDALAGKRTLAVRLGVRGSRLQYLGLVLVAAGVPLAGIVLFAWHLGALLGSASLLFLIAPLRAVFTFTDPRELNPMLGATARGVAIYAVALSTGLLIGR